MGVGILVNKTNSEFSAYNSREIMGLTVLKNNHKYIRRLRAELGYPSHHGNKVWNASLMLMEYFKHEPPKKGSRILEVGCGWGITGVYCAKNFGCHVTGLDIDESVFPYMQLHADINRVKVENVRSSYEKVSSKMLAEYDWVIGGDICFWDDLSKPLFNLVRRAQKANTRVILSDPGRPPFTQMAQLAQDKLDALYSAWFVPPPYNASGYILDV